MKELFKVDAQGSLKFSFDKKLTSKFRKAHTWFTERPVLWGFPVAFMAIDIFGFLQIMDAILDDIQFLRYIIVAGFVVGFEIAPLYLGYAICLKCYDLGSRIRKKILWFSIMSFSLGIVSNTCLRIMTMSFAYGTDSSASEISLAMTTVMILLPIITSLMSIVIGCLAFDPLLHDLQDCAKRYADLLLDKRRIEAVLAEYKDDDTEKQQKLLDEKMLCKENKLKILASREDLYSYVRLKSVGIKGIVENTLTGK